MVGGNISAEKVDLLIYGPSRPILENGFSGPFVLHAAETRHDLERLTPAILQKIRGIAVTYTESNPPIAPAELAFALILVRPVAGEAVLGKNRSDLAVVGKLRGGSGHGRRGRAGNGQPRRDEEKQAQ